MQEGNKKIQLLLLPAVYMAAGMLSAQAPAPVSFRVENKIRAIDDRFGRSMLVAPCFQYTNPIEEFRNIGSAGQQLQKAPIRLPDMRACKDTAYGFIFFGGTTSGFAPGYVLMVLGNNRRLELPHPVWVDRNNNLDLSDDGPPDTSVYYRTAIDIRIPSAAPGGGEYSVRLSRFPSDSFFSYKNMVNEFYKKFSGTKKFADANHSFREQRLNILASDSRHGSDSFRLGFKDVNCNGLYNEAGIDEILVGEWGKPLLSELAIVLSEEGKTEFEWELKRFRIDSLPAHGKTASIRYLNDARLEQSLSIDKKIPRFRYCKVESGKVRKASIRRLRGEAVYIYLWNSKHDRFGADSATINKIINNRKGVRVLCLNYGDSPKWVARFNQYYSTRWNMGFSARHIHEKLHVVKLPAGILIDKKQRVTHPSIQPSGVLEMLNN